MRILLSLFALLVPRNQRPRWREEWRAELQYGGRRMLLGALPDAWAMRRLAAGCGLPAAGSRALAGLTQDLRLALRRLRASPGFAAGIVLSLFTGVAANIVAFSVVNAAVFRPFDAIRDQHELVRLTLASGTLAPGFPIYASSIDEYHELMRLSSLHSLSAHQSARLAVELDGQATFVEGALVSSNYFAVLGVTPGHGRFFDSPADDGAGSRPVVVISNALWTSRFNRDTSVIGRVIIVNRAALSIVAVAPPGFTGARQSDARPDVWLPLGLAELVVRDRTGRPAALTAGRTAFDFVGRRQPGVTLAQVQQEASALAARLSIAPERRLTATTSAVWRNDPRRVAPEVLAFMMIPLLVLTVGCVNAANLMLARAAREALDWTVRLTLGASRWRVVRQVLVEASLVGMGAAVAGFIVAWWVLQLIASWLALPMPVDRPVLLFSGAISAVSVLAFAVGPAVRVLGLRTARGMPVASSAGPVRSRVRFLRIAVQAALSVGTLVTGLQFTRTVFAQNPNLATLDSPESLILVDLDMDPLRLEHAEARQLLGLILHRMRLVPGVEDAGLSTSGLVRGAYGGRTAVKAWLPENPNDTVGVLPIFAAPRTLTTVGARWLEGREFLDEDHESNRHVVVNRSFADRYLGGRAVGRSFTVSIGQDDTVRREVSVVGVVDGVMKRGDTEGALIYFPQPVGHEPSPTLYVRRSPGSAVDAAILQAAVREVDQRVPLGRVRTLSEAREEAHQGMKLMARGAAILGGLALLLAATGLYSVVTYVVSFRRRELGVRLALGAAPHALVSMVVRQGLTPTLVGCVLGAGGAAAVGALVRSRMHGTATVDPSLTWPVHA